MRNDEDARRQGEAQRQDIDNDEKGGGKHENIPPQKSNEPYRGREAKPPLDPRITGPSPSPSEPPKLPDREEIRPETLTPADWILITPKKLQLSAEDLVLRMRGNERTQGRLTHLREVGEDVAEERSDVKLVHIGGARDSKGQNSKEFYAENPLREKLGIKTTKGAAFADLTFQDVNTKALYHISLYRVSSGTTPLKEEIAHALKLAINTKGETKLIVMVPNVRGDGFVNEKAFKQFLHETLDAVRGSPRSADMSDLATRDRIIRYFTQLQPK